MVGHTIAVLGASGVGKTHIIKHLLQDEFEPETGVKEAKEYNFNLTLNSLVHELTLIDTLENDPKTEETINNSDGYLVIYNVCNEESFFAAKTIIDDICTTLGNQCKVPVILVSNKVSVSEGVAVSEYDAMTLAKERNISYTGLANTNSETVKSLFTQMVEEIERCPVREKKCSKKECNVKSKSCCTVL